MKGTIIRFSELFSDGINDVVFRYSSPDVFYKTLSKMSLRFTRGDCFNDYEDGEVVNELYLDCLSELIQEGEIDKDFFVAAAMTEVKHLVWLVGEDIATQIECKPFICCFSKEKDSLQMWQYYSKGGNFEGYNIGFRLNKLLKQMFEIYPFLLPDLLHDCSKYFFYLPFKLIFYEVSKCSVARRLMIHQVHIPQIYLAVVLHVP